MSDIDYKQQFFREIGKEIMGVMQTSFDVL